MIVTIDGPAGTGKSTVAKQLAKAIGFEYLDTGAMYRMIASQAALESVDLKDSNAIAELAIRTQIDFQNGKAILNGNDVTDQLSEFGLAASIVAQNTQVRDVLVQRQRELAENRNIVCEGRDQGTVVFPTAERKFYLTATAEIRAERRLEELLKKGKEVTYQQLLDEQNERDQRDENREVAPLKPAADAKIIDTTTLSIEEVVEALEELVRSAQ
jgi:cytidylate kinase